MQASSPIFYLRIILMLLNACIKLVEKKVENLVKNIVKKIVKKFLNSVK